VRQEPQQPADVSPTARHSSLPRTSFGSPSGKLPHQLACPAARQAARAPPGGDGRPAAKIGPRRARGGRVRRPPAVRGGLPLPITPACAIAPSGRSGLATSMASDRPARRRLLPLTLITLASVLALLAIFAVWANRQLRSTRTTGPRRAASCSRTTRSGASWRSSWSTSSTQTSMFRPSWSRACLRGCRRLRGRLPAHSGTSACEARMRSCAPARTGGVGGGESARPQATSAGGGGRRRARRLDRCRKRHARPEAAATANVRPGRRRRPSG
jgi:hypothetical protein